VELDGRRWNVGGFNNSCPTWNHCHAQLCPGLYGTCAYLNKTQPSYTHPTANTSSFRYAGHTTGPTIAPFPYNASRHSAATPWPPAGIHLSVNFTAPPSAPASVAGVTVTVHYELYQGVPALSKWIVGAHAARSHNSIPGYMHNSNSRGDACK
jgi:hypothetical protein